MLNFEQAVYDLSVAAGRHRLTTDGEYAIYFNKDAHLVFTYYGNLFFYFMPIVNDFLSCHKYFCVKDSILKGTDIGWDDMLMV